MTHLIYVTWENTEDNHAGMKYLCQKLQELYPNEYIAHEMLRPANSKPVDSSNALGRLLGKIKQRIKKFHRDYDLKKLNEKFANELILDSTDKVILMEYLDNNVNQYIVACTIRKKHPEVKLYALCHLVPQKINKIFTNTKLRKWVNKVDYLVTLGSSLTHYYYTRNIPQSKILTSFHYIDDYYITQKISNISNKVLVQGNQMRDMAMLENIVRNNPTISFVVCQGIQDLSKTFGKYSNVELMPFMEEEKLKGLMQDCPISLNVMHDTIGSNVIVTSMGMGEAMICSDVGSIRDYCDESNCIFCNSVNDFSNALKSLTNNRIVLEKMRQSSVRKAYQFNITNFHKFLSSL